MPTLQITIKMDSEAFGEEPWCELATLLVKYVRELEQGGDMGKRLFDSDDNTVGEAKVTP